MSSRNKTDVKKIFEFWCEVSRVPRVESSRSVDSSPAGVIVESFPESFRDAKTIADIPVFAFPCEFESESVQSYSFVLTTDDSKWRFGFCRHDPKSNTAMVIITHLPWHDTFLRLLNVLAELRRTDNGDFKAFLSETYNRGVPEPGCNLTLFYNGGTSNFVFERPLQFQLPSIPENHNLNLYYNFAEPKNMIAVFAAMLAERRIIFTSRRLDRLSSCIQAANAFLYPMVWQHIFIPVLPMKLKDYLSAPMPYLIGVPQMVLETMTPDELGEVVTLNCDTKIFDSPFDDVHEMPPEIVSQMKKQLSSYSEHIGDRVSKIFLGVLVQLIGGYRDAVEFRDTGKKFNREKFIESRPSHLRPFLTKMMELQIFQQFIDERLEMLNTGLGFSDEFELETVRYAEKMKKRGRNYVFLKNVRDKVKESSRGMKTVYKDIKSKFRDITPPSNPHFRSHLASNSQHDRIDGYVVGSKSGGGHHSAPSSPVFNKRVGVTASGLRYASPEPLNGTSHPIRRAPPLAMSSSSSHIQPNGYAHPKHSIVHHNNHLASSPNDSPASSICSSEMNLSQELQNHPLFKTPIVDRSLKPSNSVEPNHRYVASRTGGPLPPRPPPPAPHSLLMTPAYTSKPAGSTPAYYNQPFAIQQKPQHTHAKPPRVPRPLTAQKSQPVTPTYTSTPHKIITTDSSYDSPPDMLSPPVPPRRQTGNAVAQAAAAVHAGIHRLERNCWQDLPHEALRTSSSSSSSTMSSSGSSASFVSAVSSFSPPKPAPVPAPRLKKDKESLRSLQPQHLQPAASSLKSGLSCSSPEDTMNDLISLDDSNNTSFDLEDFDPLNQNARPMPSMKTAVSKRSTTLPSGASPNMMCASSISNPLYPYFKPQQLQLPTSRPPPLPTSMPPPMPPPDEDFELLRKYGLDQFTLTTPHANHANGPTTGMNNWTTFD